MNKIKDDVLHYREVIITIERIELENLISEYAAKSANFYGTKYKAKVEIEEATEGSPSYKTGYRAKIKIIEDLTKNEN